MADPIGFVRQGNALVEDGEGGALDGVVEDGKVLQVAVRGRGLLALEASEWGRPRAPWLAASLELVPPMSLASLVVSTKLTGALEVRRGDSARRLYFEDGQFTGGQSSSLEDSFGQILWRAGRLSLDQLLIAVEEVKAGKKRIGRVLIDLGYLTQSELRPFLRRQAEAIFEAACVIDRGHASFHVGVTNRNPIRFFGLTEALLERVGDAVLETQALRAALGDLDALFSSEGGQVERRLGEAETAVLQLLSSTKGAPLPGRQLLDKSGLGELDGLRALANLVHSGLVRPERSAVGTTQERDRMAGMCALLNRVIESLQGAGFGFADEVAHFAEEPPADAPPALSLFRLDQAVNPTTLLDVASRATPPVSRPDVEAALSALLDFALFHARDTLPPHVSRELDDAAALLSMSR